MSSRILAIDTASPTGSVALLDEGQLQGEILLHLKTTHSERLLTAVDQLLQGVGCELSDLDGIAVTRGPGSFTGLRVGIATAKGLALSLECPLVGVSTLEALAANLSFAGMPVCAMLDARKNEVYAGLFQYGSDRMQILGQEEVLAPEKLLDSLQGDTLFVGDGAERYRSVIVRKLAGRAHFAPTPLNQPRAAMVAWLAMTEMASVSPDSADALTPVYIRPSEAELSWQRKADQPSIEG
jgi:tRNA threonylcarbamoyladenosine biosynthesis protein TsaB